MHAKTSHYHELLDMLMHKRIELSRRVRAISADHARGLPADSGEQAVVLENAEVLDELAREAIDELSKINMALQRVEAGTFGVCVSCGADIDERRLRAVPWAARCIRCANEGHDRKLG
ncbi:MAG: TraR/DksA family transcriptional regulator [Pseudomonadota bacterium]